MKKAIPQLLYYIASISKLKFILVVILMTGLLFNQSGGLPYPFQNYVSIKKQRVFHYPESPLFKGRKYNIDFIADIPGDSITNAVLFFKSDSMENYREFPLIGNNGLFRFQYNPKLLPALSIEYFFVIEARNNQFYAVPLNSKGKLTPTKRHFIDPVLFYQKKMSIEK